MLKTTTFIYNYIYYMYIIDSYYLFLHTRSDLFTFIYFTYFTYKASAKTGAF